MFETCYARDLTLKRVDLTTHIKNRLVFLAAPPAVAQHLGDCVLQVREEGGDGGAGSSSAAGPHTPGMSSQGQMAPWIWCSVKKCFLTWEEGT